MTNLEFTQRVCDYLNDLLKHDRNAIACLIASRVPCNKLLADHPTCEVVGQHGGFSVSILGLLNGLCRGDTPCFGPIVAVFESPKIVPEGVDPEKCWKDLLEFRLATKEEQDAQAK